VIKPLQCFLVGKTSGQPWASLSPIKHRSYSQFCALGKGKKKEKNEPRRIPVVSLTTKHNSQSHSRRKFNIPTQPKDDTTTGKLPTRSTLDDGPICGAPKGNWQTRYTILPKDSTGNLVTPREAHWATRTLVAGNSPHL